MDVKIAIDDCKVEIKELEAKVADRRIDIGIASPLADLARRRGIPKVDLQLNQRRLLKGHYGKIYGMQWASNSRNLVSAGQDGKMVVWNAFTTHKVYAIPLRSSWVMDCAYSPSGLAVACGGLDNLVTVYSLPKKAEEVNDVTTTPPVLTKPAAELHQHEGYISCVKFVSDAEIVSASGDSTLILWDLETKTPKTMFADHAADVLSVASHEASNMIVSGSCDCLVKLWDKRTSGKRAAKTFPGHESDVNSVAFFSNGQAIASGSDDSSCRIFDIRAYQQIQCFASDRILCGVTSVDVSKSGRVLAASYDDGLVHLWDSQLAEISQVLRGHEDRVSVVGVSPDGKAIATGSWDTLVRIWA